MQLVGKKEYASAVADVAAKAAADAATKAAAEAAAKAAAGSAASTAATAAAKTAAEAAAKTAAEAAAKTAAEAAAKTAAEASAKAAAEASAKAAAEASAKAAAEASAKAAAESSAKAASEASAKALGESASKAAGESSASIAKKASEFASKNAGKIVGGLAAGAAALYAMNKANELNGKKVGITKTEAGSTGIAFGIGADKKVVLITYDPSLKIRSKDKVVITGSKTTPPMDGEFEVKSVKSETQVLVDVGKDISAYAPGGDITLKTSFESQMLGMMTDAGEIAGDTAGNVLGAAGEGLGKGVEGLLGGLGISMDALKWGAIALFVVILIFFILKFLGKKKQQ